MNIFSVLIEHRHSLQLDFPDSTKKKKTYSKECVRCVICSYFGKVVLCKIRYIRIVIIESMYMYLNLFLHLEA